MDTSIPFDDFIAKFDKSIRRTSELPERGRVQMSVMLQKRFRGETLGDRIGRWNFSTNHWVEPELLELMPLNIYTRNVVKKIVRTNASAMSQASIVVECDPRKENDIRCKKNALICQRIADWFDDEHWTTDFALHINELKQLSHGVFIKTVCGEYARGEEDWAEEAFNMPSEAACPQCGWKGYVKDGDQSTCPQCGGQVQTLDQGQDVLLDILKDGTKQPEYRTELKVVPALAMILDERYSQGGNIDKCRFVIERDLISRFEIEQEFGVTDLGSAPDWSFATKWLYTLQSGVQYPFKSFKQSQDTIRELDLFEVRRIYFTADFLDCYTAKQGYNFESKKDLGFALEANQNAGERVRQLAQQDAEQKGTPVQKRGLCVALITGKILGYKLEDHRQIFDYTYFLSDPYSVWGLCYSELETHQHLINQTLTAIGNQVQSNQNIGVFNREAFDEDDISGDKSFIFTRANSGVDDIGKAFDMIPAIPVSADTWTLYQHMESAIDQDSLASKEMQGIPSGVKTAYQAQMNRDQSVGTLAPANQSMASCKVSATKKQCIHVQDAQDIEFLTDLCVADDGLITAEDIEHFLQSDLDDTVTFTYQPGSEVPKTRFDRQQDVAEFGQLLQVLAMANPGGITPQLIQTLISKAAEYKNLEGIDPGNAELDKELAERRYEIIQDALSKSLHQQLQVPQAPQMLAQSVLSQAMSNPILMPLPQENHTIATDYWRDKAIQEMKKEMPDLLLVQACQIMIQRHSDGTVAAGQKQVNEAMQIQQPATDMQNQQAKQQQAAAAQASAAQTADSQNSELQKQAMETQRQREDQSFQMTSKLIDSHENEEQRKHDLKIEAKRA